MLVDVVLLPRELRPEHLAGRAVAVFDVLRATTTMAAALTAGVREIRIFDDLDSARDAAAAFEGRRVLVGERDAVRPPGFDLGNSPGAFQRDLHEGATLFMTTTNGTRAILAAARAPLVLTAALVNAGAVAAALAEHGSDVTLLASGTQGYISSEDVLGAGSVIAALRERADVSLASDVAWMAERLFLSQRHELPAAIRASRGGHNVVRAGLSADIAFCADLDRLSVVGVVVPGDPPAVRRR